MNHHTTTTDLRAAREASVVRFLSIATAIKAEAGIKEHILRASLSGLAHVKERKIIAPEGKTRKQLYILAHECAHVILHHSDNKARHLEEVEAEQWAHAALRRHGIAVPRSMTLRAKKHVRYKIRQALSRGAKRIAPEAKAYVRSIRPKPIMRK